MSLNPAKHTTRFCAGLTIGILLLLCNCTNAPVTSDGGGSRGGNPVVAGTIIGLDSAKARNVHVSLIAENYNPLTDAIAKSVSTGITDSLGAFSIVAPDTGWYNVEALASLNGTRLIRLKVRAVRDSINVLPPDTLHKPGTIKVVLQKGIGQTGGYIYIPGTTVFTYLQNNSGFVILDSVPVGTIADIAYSTTNTTGFTVLRYGIQVKSGDTTVVWNSDWRYSRKITMNTASSGANVNGDVTNFPVLIRLTTANYDFTKAKINGDDIRFAKSDTTFLPYEIERWDSVTQVAEVWVKVDTVYGNDSSQSITMYWGNPDAQGQSDSKKVFDTTAGFAGVWHLGTDCSDATAGNHDGTNFGATDAAGIIGSAKKFNGSSYIQVPGLLGSPPSITISAWVHLDSVNGYGQEIVSLGDAVAIRADQESPPDGTAGFFCSKVSSSDTVHVFTNTGVFISKTGWRYLVYTVDAAMHLQSVYIDGIFQYSTNDINPINYSGLGPNTVLGAHGNNKTQSYTFGSIDEARVCRVARTADWIKLCYMNQKEQDALVKW